MIFGHRFDLVHLPFSITIASWSLLIATFCGWNISKDYDIEYSGAVSVASSNFDKDIAYRRWAAKQEGMYILHAPETPTKAYSVTMPEHEITTTTGKHLTLITASYMIRQIHDQSNFQDGVRGHLTSLKPLREQNSPDPWEREALQHFEQGAKEVDALGLLEGKPYLRFMRPLETETTCLKCHEHQGYKVGDVPGGLSISVPWLPHKERL